MFVHNLINFIFSVAVFVLYSYVLFPGIVVLKEDGRCRQLEAVAPAQVMLTDATGRESIDQSIDSV